MRLYMCPHHQLLSLAFIASASLLCLASGCSQQAQSFSAQAPLTADFPTMDPTNNPALLGAVSLGSAGLGKEQFYDVFLSVNNPGPGALSAQSQVKGSPDEYSTDAIGGFVMPAGHQASIVTLCQVKRLRVHPVTITVQWRLGSRVGKTEYVVSPQMLPIT